MLRDPEDPSRDDGALAYGRWPQAWCDDATRKAVQLGLCAADEVESLLAALADDPSTSSPRRLTAKGGVRHARSLLGQSAQRLTRPSSGWGPWCGDRWCNQQTRQREDPDTGAPAGTCTCVDAVAVAS